MVAKFNLNKVVGNVQKLYKGTEADKIGVGSALRDLSDDNFMKMPAWWQQVTNTPGLPYGKIVMIAGDSDSGKTSCAIAAMKAAQEQGVAVLYVETEGKTTTADMTNWGVDPSQVMLVQESVAEKAFTKMFQLWDEFFAVYPNEKLLLVFDSLGNVVSRRDSEIDLSEQSQKPGGKGQINRMGLNKLVAKREENDVAVLLINYTYDNIGSPGKTNAGGKAVNFFSSLTYQTTRKGWLEKTVKGEKIRTGAVVTWKLFKNHLNKTNPGPKVVELEITAEGFKVKGQQDE